MLICLKMERSRHCRPFLKKEENSSARQRTRILLRKTRNGNVEIRISVRSLVEFILRSGSIDNRKGAAPDNAIWRREADPPHDTKKNGSDYQAEVVMRYSWSTPLTIWWWKAGLMSYQWRRCYHR